MCMTKLSTKGFDEYLENIAKAGQDVDQAATEAVVVEGDIIHEGMEEKVPRLTGELASYLVIEAPQQDGNYISVRVGMDQHAPADVARRGNAWEFGFRRGGHQYGPRSYIRAGFDEKKRQALAAAKAILQKWGVI